LLCAGVVEASFSNVGQETISSGSWTWRFYSVHPSKIHYSNLISFRSFPYKFCPVHCSPIIYYGAV
jgi:hypothetical protein